MDEQPHIRYYHVQLTGLTREGEAVGRVTAALPEESVVPGHWPLLASEKQAEVELNATGSVEAPDNLQEPVSDAVAAQELRVPAGIPGEQVIVSVEEPPQRAHR